MSLVPSALAPLALFPVQALGGSQALQLLLVLDVVASLLLLLNVCLDTEHFVHVILGLLHGEAAGAEWELLSRRWRWKKLHEKLQREWVVFTSLVWTKVSFFAYGSDSRSALRPALLPRLQRVQAHWRVSRREEEVPVPEARRGAMQTVEEEGGRVEEGACQGVARGLHGREGRLSAEGDHVEPGRRGQAVCGGRRGAERRVSRPSGKSRRGDFPRQRHPDRSIVVW
mmetsp:Transcript_36177/g.91008  ORF Transcript_36177/g.91008 Transcript_36177/m.91008 type:complete len:227 (-) Transcript_36177:112-792(-)